MSAVFAGVFAKGQSFQELLQRVSGMSEGGRPVKLHVDPRSAPYLDHRLAGWVDGPPSSNVAWVLSGADPDGHSWRRFTISKVGLGTWELAAFPTPFGNEVHPLSPGVPPSVTRKSKH